MKRLIIAVACMGFLTNAASILVQAEEHPSPSSRAIQRDVPEGAALTTALGPPELAPSTIASSTNSQQVLVEFDFYRVLGNMSGAAWVNPDVSRSEVLVPVLPGGDKLCVFTTANFIVSGVRLRLNDNGWTWDGKDSPPSGKAVQMISSPKVIVLLNESFQVAVHSQQGVEYLQKRPDGLFELKRLVKKTGLTIKANVAEGDREHIILRDLTTRLRSIEGREPIEGVSLDVGRPIVETQEYRRTITLEPDRDYGIWLRTEGYGSLLVRVKVSRVSPRGEAKRR